MSDYVSIPVNPMGAVRQTKRDKWKKRPVVERYHQFRDDLRYACKSNNFELGDTFEIIFYIPMPKSWSKKKTIKTYNTPHNQKPDIDNLVKAVMDTLMTDDKQVWKIKAEKRWSDSGSIMINNGVD